MSIEPQFCVVGLGAIGGLMAARLARAGATVRAIARGATLQAVRQRGLRWIEDGRERSVEIEASDDPRAFGPQDVLVISTKTTALAQLADSVAPLIGPHTRILSAMNGVPWWFTHGLEAARNLRLETVDPQGRISAAMPPAQVLGCVVHLSAAMAEPGLVRLAMGNRLIVGDPQAGPRAGDRSERLLPVADALEHAGFEVERAPSIQREVWYKLWGNMTINPMSAITGASSDRLLDDPQTRELASAIMREAAETGARIGLPIDADPEERHAVTRKLGAMRPSMLLDAEAGRPVELDALLSVVREIAQQVGVATPFMDALLGLARVHGQVRGLYP